MADYILVRKSRNILSSIIHIVLNVLLGFGSIFLTTISGSWILGILLVLVSKWRIFAVRPRFWLLNIKSSLVDLIVGSSFVFIAYCAGTTVLPVHIAVALLYTLWLIILKPKSSEIATELQSLAAVFLGTTAAVMLSASLDSIVIVLAAFLIGYAAARHVLVQGEDNDFSLVTAVCGLISAELAWLSHSWLIVYTFGNSGVVIPQISIILTVFAFVFGRVYKSIIKHDNKLKADDTLVPIIFSVAVILVIFLFFSKPVFDV
ncbi:hypothetical protein IJH02_01660 [Candidatus Saccharibacteria bacterium]|nr:hypothetical protein [Candidatus Saccharibacteria bacterium]